MVDSVCARCKNDLTEEEKVIGIPICQDCIDSLVSNITDTVKASEKRKIEKNVEDFARFILSSGNLFNLDQITILQCCFNIFMRETVGLKDKNLSISEKIFKDAVKFIEKELNSKKNISDNPNVEMMSLFDELIKNGVNNENGNKKNLKTKKDKKEKNKDKKENKKGKDIEDKKENKKGKDIEDKKEKNIEKL